MGQTIEVTATTVGRVALFSTDRSITGQDGHTYSGPPADPRDPPAELASRLFNEIGGVNHVHVMSNMVAARRTEDWDDETLAEATGVVESLFVFYPPIVEQTPEEHDQQLRDENYNATITDIRAHNSDLWVMRVTPDEPIDPFDAGKYTTLALGYWEPRADLAAEEFDTPQREKMARRSYSVSSSIIDESGELVESHPDEVEFYIVQVRPGEEEIPALTPRIFTKGVGDRIYMGRKFTGHYTLDGVNPSDNVVFLSTGTGEAPQNTMTAELFRRGHQGRIISLVTVRYSEDLAYTEQHDVLLERYPDYRYMTITTREPGDLENKVYIQDVIASGRLEEEMGAPLDPTNTHVFLCGNPAMIGLPKWDEDGEMEFPEVLGVCQMLHERGFTIDHRRERGNVHYEEYWKER